MNNLRSLSNGVIVCTRNRYTDICTFLCSLQNQTLRPVELVIIDSSDKPLSQDQLFVELCARHEQNGTRMIVEHTRPGTSYQRNVGAMRAHADILHFFDDDVELASDYIEQMTSIFTENPTYGGGMGSVQNLPAPAGYVYRGLRSFFLLQQDRSSGMFTWSGMPTHTYGTHTFKQVEVLGGCCMAFRRSIYMQYMFDENLEKMSGYAYMEDCDLSWRVSRNHALFFNPAARLNHYHSPANRDGADKRAALYIHNYSYLFFKNLYPQTKIKIIAYLWSIFGLYLQAVVYRQWNHVRGYTKGLRYFYSNRNKQ
jgi:GT2 family glycosyltransferase